MRWSIRYRLLVPLAVLLLGIVGITTWSVTAAARHAEQRIAQQVRGVTQTLAGASFSLTQPILEQMKGLSGADYLLIDSEGMRLTTFKSSTLELPIESVQQSTEEPTGEALGVTIVVEGEHFRCRRLALKSGGSLLIFYPERSLNEAIRDASRPPLFLGFFVGLGSLTMMLIVSQRLVSRIRSLERRTRQIAGGDFSPMPLPPQQDELRDLSESINEMAARLAKLQDTVKQNERFRLIGQLSSGLAHQLRNSVTGARLAVQVHAGECTAEDREALDVVLRQLSLMEANLRRFMDLGRTEAFQREPCSLLKLLDETMLLLSPQAKHAETTLRWDRPHADVTLEGDPVQLGHLFLNLMTNALEAAGPKGIVEVRGPTIIDRIVRVEIWDTGNGPPTNIVDKLFDPFITGKPEGIGLGLAVARQAAEAHAGRIAWHRENHRTCFRIELEIPFKQVLAEKH